MELPEENQPRPTEEQSPEFALTFRSHEPPVRPIWRFVLAAFFIQATDWVAGNLSYRVFSTHPILQDALYRAVGVAILLAGFHFMVQALDDVEDGEVLSSMGLRTQGALRELIVGILVGSAMICLAVSAISLIGGYSFHLTLDEMALRRFGEVCLLLLIGAAYEEMSFRGYAFQRLTMAVGPMAAIALFSLWFGTVHLWNPHSGGIWSWGFLNTIAVGVLLAVAYLRTKALWMPIGIHFGWNFTLGTIFGLPVSGLDLFSVVAHGKVLGPRWLTGGNYGLEASATGTLAILLGFLPLLLLTRKERSRI